ncbi:MAG: alpha/beta hydrolase [Lachnospiraceae bacterium]|nr:alpha/beta hydrolase [Lachnospiraceae bacterium]
MERKDNLHIHYTDVGNGQPIVFIHGWNADSTVFDFVSRSLLEYRCISYDARGHGDSDAVDNGVSMKVLAEDLAWLIESLDLECPVLAGWSMGAATIFEYVKRFGCSNLKKIILIDMSPKIVNDDVWKLGLCQGAYRIEDYFRDMTVQYENFEKFFDSNMLVSHTMPAPDAPSKSRKKDYYTLTALWHAMCMADYRDMLPKIEVPTAVFYGDPGDKYSPVTAYYLQKTISGQVDMVPFYDCGHDLMFQEPEKFAAEVKKFLEK